MPLVFRNARNDIIKSYFVIIVILFMMYKADDTKKTLTFKIKLISSLIGQLLLLHLRIFMGKVTKITNNIPLIYFFKFYHKI